MLVGFVFLRLPIGFWHILRFGIFKYNVVIVWKEKSTRKIQRPLSSAIDQTS